MQVLWDVHVHDAHTACQDRLEVLFELRHVGMTARPGGTGVALPTGVQLRRHRSPAAHSRRLERRVPHLVFRQVQRVIGQVRPRLHQGVADLLLGLTVRSLAEMRVDHLTVAVEQVLRRPVTVLKVPPRNPVVVLCHRPPDVVGHQRFRHVFMVLLELELRRVDAQYHQAVVLVLRPPVPQERQRADAVDAGVRPEVHQHHVALSDQFLDRQRFIRVEPSVDTLHVGNVRHDRTRRRFLSSRRRFFRGRYGRRLHGCRRLGGLGGRLHRLLGRRCRVNRRRLSDVARAWSRRHLRLLFRLSALPTGCDCQSEERRQKHQAAGFQR